MVKAAYQKLFANKIWLSLGVTLLTCCFLCGYVASMDVSEETVEMIVWFSVIAGGFVTILVIYQVIWGFVQIQKLKNYLNRLPVFVRERLEYDFRTGDQISDLYFTSSHLFVLQIRPGSRQGIVCIPYEEIQEVRIRPKMQVNTILEIRKTQDQPSHYVFESAGFSAGMISTINDKIAGIRARMDAPRPLPEEQKKEENRKRRAVERGKIWDSGIFHIALAFGMLMLFCYTIILAEDSQSKVHVIQDLEHAAGYGAFSPVKIGGLLFWPNLLFYLVLYGGSLFLLVSLFLFMRRRIGKKEGETVEWISRWRAAAFTVIAVLFMLLIGTVYSSDVGSWARLTEGFYLMISGF